MITYQQMGQSCLALYDRVPMQVRVERILSLEKIDRGLGGFLFKETPVEPYLKDFCADGPMAVRLPDRFDLTNWGFFMAFDGETPVGGAATAAKTPGCRMLAGREDLAVLWDIRVADGYKGQGVGQALFDMAKCWAKGKGYVQLKIECQNNNLPAVRFYHKQGAQLEMVDTYAYYNEPAYRDEVQLIWYLDL